MRKYKQLGKTNINWWKYTTKCTCLSWLRFHEFVFIKYIWIWNLNRSKIVLVGQDQKIKTWNTWTCNIRWLLLFLFQGNTLCTKGDRALAAMKALHLSTKTTYLRGYNQESFPTQVFPINFKQKGSDTFISHGQSTTQLRH